MRELISVIIPVYNIEKYVEKCINSILLQTYKNIELIIVDDGSTDNSPVICDRFSVRDERIKVYIRKMPDCQKPEMSYCIKMKKVARKILFLRQQTFRTRFKALIYIVGGVNLYSKFSTTLI